MSANGSVATFASNLSLSNTNLIVDGTILYFAETTVLAKLSTSRGAKTRITTQTSSRFDVEGGYVYFTTGELDEALRCAALRARVPLKTLCIAWVRAAAP